MPTLSAPASDPRGNFAQFEDMRRAMDSAYSRLSLSERLRADQGTFFGGAVSIGLGFINLRSFFSAAFAQTASEKITGGRLPIEVFDLVYYALIVLLFASFYLGAFKGSQSTYVRDTWKTLLGFFIGAATR
jgi:hypothetical protein